MHDHHLTGRYEAMGREYASQLEDAGRSLAEASPETLEPSTERRAFARKCAAHVEEHAPFLLAELEGIADATGLEPEVVETVPLALDARAGCSLVAVGGERTVDGAPLFARNHDFCPSFRDFATCYRTEPADGLASVGCSCVYVGRCDGVNEAGLAIGFAEVPPHEFEPGVAWQLAVRAVLDTCRTVAEAVAFLESVPHATNVNFLVGDASGEIAIVEANPAEVTTIFPDDDIVSVTREFRTESMREYQSTDRTPADCSRRQAIAAWFDERERRVTAEDLQTVMGEPDVGVCWPIDERREDPRSTIWSWTIDPAERAGHLARDSPVETPYQAVRVPENE
ncbi:C45 family peptidase [Natronoglomus mannanivorans]|uniref:C45 family peptidase n=1 Tax=Natronoglomus mannanivorans TaxID=2979990 RepID=A0AAP2YXE3_9EURY|nr:C45 family peptidase [Halobacteria archaeon AArc-xg1-1]